MLSALLLLLPTFVGSIAKSIQIKIEGVVIAEKTGKPVSNALVYAIEGEEEALTNSKGEFRLFTSRKTPLLLTVERWEYEKKKLTITDAGQKVSIKLKIKN